jgi:hypothetical protein
LRDVRVIPIGPCVEEARHPEGTDREHSGAAHPYPMKTAAKTPMTITAGITDPYRSWRSTRHACGRRSLAPTRRN